MALHPDFPESPHAIIDPSVCWLPDQSLLFDLEYAMLLLPLVHKIREQVRTWRDNNYSGASYTYWSVDFDFESKHEIIRMQDSQTGEWEEQWTGDYVFENEWQSFRTKQDRSLELTSVAHECEPGRRKLAVKVVDIFGNDTMTIVEVSV